MVIGWFIFKLSLRKHSIGAFLLQKAMVCNTSIHRFKSGLRLAEGPQKCNVSGVFSFLKKLTHKRKEMLICTQNKSIVQRKATVTGKFIRRNELHQSLRFLRVFQYIDFSIT